MRPLIGFIVVTALSLTQAATLPRNNQANGDLKERNIVGEILGALNGGGQRNHGKNNNNNAVTVTETIRETITVSAAAGNFSQTPPAAVVTDVPQVITVHMPLPPVTVTLTMMQPCPVAAPPAAQQPHQGVVPVPLPNQPAPVASAPSAPPAASTSSGLPEPPPPPPPRPPVEIPSSPPPPPPPVETSSAAPAASSAPPAALPPLEPLSPPPAASTSSVASVPALPITTPEALPILSGPPSLPPVAEVTPPVVAAPAVPGANLDGLTLTNELNLGNLVQQTNVALRARATPAA